MAVLVRTDDVRRQNTRLVMNTLRRLPHVSRTEIVTKTGLSPATVSSITSGLLADNILISEEQLANFTKRGRPRISLMLNPEVGCVLALVLSDNTVNAALQDYSGQVLLSRMIHMDTHAADSDGVLAIIRQLIHELLAQRSSTMPLLYIAMAVQGVVDVARKELLWSPITLAQHIPFAADLQQHFQVPVFVDNDCNMLAKALQCLHPEEVGRNFAAILLSQGIGLGLMLEGQLFSGVSTSGNEFGHMVHQPEGALCHCGQRGCIEAYASDYAIWRRLVGQPDNIEPLDSQAETQLAEFMVNALVADGVERQAWREASKAIAYGLRSLFALTDPVTIAFAGKSAVVFQLMEADIRQALPRLGNPSAEPPTLLWYDNPEELILQGCSFVALQAVDHSLHRSNTD